MFGANPRAGLPGVRRVDFSLEKYGVTLGIDARFISALPAFDPSSRPHWLTYFDLTLITRGRGTIVIEDEVHEASPGTVFFSRPGDLRRLRLAPFDGACVFFTADFVRDAFANARFLDQFGFFARPRPSAVLRLTPSQRATFLRRFRTMDREFVSLPDDASDYLRAALYELLVVVNRWYRARHPGGAATASRPAIVDRFVALVERRLAADLTVEQCAGQLGVTSGHLGALCRQHLGQSPIRYINGRLMQEARRLLLFTDEPAASVGFRLGFGDPAYFGRRFKQASGQTPRQFGQRRLRPRD